MSRSRPMTSTSASMFRLDKPMTEMAGGRADTGTGALQRRCMSMGRRSVRTAGQMPRTASFSSRSIAVVAVW